jgi:cobalamin-dependent methionine synthase I
MSILQLTTGTLDRNEIIRLAGGGDFAVGSPIQKTLDHAICVAESLAKGVGTYGVFPSAVEGSKIAIITDNDQQPIRVPSPGTARMQGVQAAAVFVVTIGGDLEQEVDRCFLQEAALEGLFLDAAGSVATEAVADELVSAIAEDARHHNMMVTYRFSPGYCNWKLELQKAIFHLIDPPDIGVELKQSMLMVPRKSVSGMVFLGEEISPLNPCLVCNRSDCRDRRT